MLLTNTFEHPHDRLVVDVWSDVMCPFCYLGDTLLAQAVAKSPHGSDVEIRYHSFQLMPHLPADHAVGLNELLEKERGFPQAQARAMNAQVAARAAQLGLDFRLENAIATNTQAAHRLTHFAKSHGRQHEMVDRLFCAYFTDGLNVGDYDVLAGLAAEIGLDRYAAREALDGGAFEADVKADVREAEQLGITGVPFFIFDGRYAVTGAQPVESFLEYAGLAAPEPAPAGGRTAVRSRNGRAADGRGQPGVGPEAGSIAIGLHDVAELPGRRVLRPCTRARDRRDPGGWSECRSSSLQREDAVALDDFAGVRDTDIVVGVDGSPSAGAALRWAVGQARRTGARVRAVTASEVPFYAEWMPMIPFADLATGAGKMLAESVAEALSLEAPGVEVLPGVVPGHPAQALVDESAHAALLVVGCRGHHGFAGTLLGSVSLHCAQHAHCPVVVVRGESEVNARRVPGRTTR